MLSHRPVSHLSHSMYTRTRSTHATSSPRAGRLKHSTSHVSPQFCHVSPQFCHVSPQFCHVSPQFCHVCRQRRFCCRMTRSSTRNCRMTCSMLSLHRATCFSKVTLKSSFTPLITPRVTVRDLKLGMNERLFNKNTGIYNIVWDNNAIHNGNDNSI